VLKNGDPAEIAAFILRLADSHAAWLTGPVFTTPTDSN
jgi:NAD(P)-dependent dehydrogenase (short-subunit alcohol dehydrogenase family)